MPKVKPYSNTEGTYRGMAFWCLGCKESHMVPLTNPQGYVWTYNGDADKPTFSPSLKLDWKEKHCCHSVVTLGRIFYCSDSTHALKGQTVDLPEWPGDKA